MNAMNRVGAFSGAAYVLLANVASTLVGVGPSAEGSPGQVMLDEQQRIAENPWVRLAFALIILAYLAWMVFVGYLYSRVRDGGWFATTALVGGVAAITVNLAATSGGLVVYLLRDVLTPDIARALTDLDGIGHMLLVLPAGAFVLFGSAAAMVTKVLGRVTELGRNRHRRDLHRRDRRHRPALERRPLSLAVPAGTAVGRGHQPSTRFRPEPDSSTRRRHSDSGLKSDRRLHLGIPTPTGGGDRQLFGSSTTDLGA